MIDPQTSPPADASEQPPAEPGYGVSCLVVLGYLAFIALSIVVSIVLLKWAT